MGVYQTYIHTMNANIRARFARRDNPFVFKHISHLPQSRNSERRVAEGPPCVVLASPGMLQSGTSRELLEVWAPDPRNGLIITGYSVEGTPARVSAVFFFLLKIGHSATMYTRTCLQCICFLLRGGGQCVRTGPLSNRRTFAGYLERTGRDPVSPRRQRDCAPNVGARDPVFCTRRSRAKLRIY